MIWGFSDRRLPSPGCLQGPELPSCARSHTNTLSRPVSSTPPSGLPPPLNHSIHDGQSELTHRPHVLSPLHWTRNGSYRSWGLWRRLERSCAGTLLHRHRAHPSEVGDCFQVCGSREEIPDLKPSGFYQCPIALRLDGVTGI